MLGSLLNKLVLDNQPAVVTIAVRRWLKGGPATKGAVSNSGQSLSSKCCELDEVRSLNFTIVYYHSSLSRSS